MIPLVDLSRQYRSIQKQIDKAVLGAIESSDFILGKRLTDFEHAFAKYIGAKYCIGVASGTDAILLSLRAAGVGPGDEVIAPAMTFISTVLPILHVGAKPVFVDVDPRTFTITAEAILPALSRRTKVVIPVHLYGLPADLDPIEKLARKHNLLIIEDACQAHGALYRNNMAGAIGDIGCFSFYPSKNLGAYGDAGAVVTRSSRIARKVRILCNVGQTKKYVHSLAGYNSRLDAIQAAVLSAKLPYLTAWNARRREIAHMYRKLLADTPLSFQDEPENRRSNYHLFVVCSAKRDKLVAYLHTHGVGTGIHYLTPVHLQPALKTLGYHRGNFPVSEKLGREVLSLPIFPELSQREIINICSLIHAFFLHDKK